MVKPSFYHIIFSRPLIGSLPIRAPPSVSLMFSLHSSALRSFPGLHGQQAVLDQRRQQHHQQVQPGRQRAGGAGDREEGDGQRHGSGGDG